MNDAVTIINNVGFPIFCVLALGALVGWAFKEITKANAERELRLYETIAATREQLNNAIEVNASFVEILSEMRNNVGVMQDDILKIKQQLKMKS
jgi:hypothetical protein